jgi:hypothetical protein
MPGTTSIAGFTPTRRGVHARTAAIAASLAVAAPVS